MDNNRKTSEITKAAPGENTHKGHRGRMRERYAKNGLDSFQPHEVLEMLLFRSIAQGNTNPTAHALLEKCGSMEAVLEGNTAVPGAGEKTLAMLRQTNETLERLFRDTLTDAEKIGRSQIYTAAVCWLRRCPDGVFVMITGRDGACQEMTVLTETTPAEILKGLKSLMEPDQLCHIACMTDPESLRPLRRQYGRTILGWLLCLTQNGEAVWL